MRYICLLRIILRCLGVNDMDNIIDIELTGRSTRREQKLWQYDYGQVLRIAGKEFPKVTEVQFSLKQSGGHTLDRIGTSNNGLLTVQIPNELLQNKGATSDYTIYAFVYLSGDGYGNTKYMIQLPVESRPEPTDPSEDPSIDPSIFKDAVNAVNASADRAETAEKSAKESADKAKGYAESAGKSKGDVEKARDNAISAIGIEKESALRGIASKTEESLQKIQSQTEESQNSIKQSIADATEKKTELDGAISNATNAKGNLDKTVQSAGNAKKELESSIGKAGEAKTALDSSISSAGEKQLALDATVEQANTVDASLKEQIGSAEQIQANVEQIAKNKADISSLNEDLIELNKISEKISSISIIQKCEVADGYYWNFIAGEKEVKEINENYIAVKIPVEGNKLIVYGEFQDWASRYVNNGAYTPVESTYISHNTQTSKVAEFYNIPTDAKYLCLSFYKGGLDTSIESINVVSGEFRKNLSYRKTDFVDRLEVYTKDEVYTKGEVYTKDEVDDKLGEIHINKIYVATTGSDTEGNGTKEKPYATVLKANDVVTNASEKNKYEIIVADGTYTDLQEKYKGQNGSDYQGVIAKSYVTYKSQSNNPEKCIFIWDGGVGYDTISNDTCTNKCFFHINSQTIDTVIKGFKFVGTNLRYCVHFESNCLSTPYIENCIFDWHGRDYSPKNGPVIGMGGSIFSHITFKDCKFLNSQNDAGIQWHDNTYPYDWINGRYEPEGLCPKGAVIECIDCLFDNLNIQVRSQNEDRPMPCCLIVKNCGGLKNVYPTIIAGGTKNYWKLFNQCSFIKNDLLTDATETTTYDEMTSVKTSTD